MGKEVVFIKFKHLVISFRGVIAGDRLLNGKFPIEKNIQNIWKNISVKISLVWMKLVWTTVGL